MFKCDSVWLLEPWYHIDSIMRCIKYHITEGLGVKCTAHHWEKVSKIESLDAVVTI